MGLAPNAEDLMRTLIITLASLATAALAAAALAGCGGYGYGYDTYGYDTYGYGYDTYAYDYDRYRSPYYGRRGYVRAEPGYRYDRRYVTPRRGYPYAYAPRDYYRGRSRVYVVP